MPAACFAGAALLLLAAAALPVDALVDALAARFATARSFRADLVHGLQVLRAALAVNGLVLVALPAWIEAGYEKRFGLPSTRGELCGWRLRRP